ncbi:glycosyltransferase family 4 protein [Candidatus Leptofilum sp.]|uniref:glycosyltransferase family 4 protein n=1 Tax=Candidatus Leptofilum sp. TaxID=3241576 RepID=UPI003B58F04B
MKILLLTPQLPYPPHQGTSLRNFHIIRGLAQACEVSLLSFLEPGQTIEAEKIAPLAKLCQRIETVPVPQRTTGKRLQQLLATRRPDMAHRLFSQAFNVRLLQMFQADDFDIVQIEGIEMARYLPVIRQGSPRSKIVFDDHNAETELQRRNFLTDLRQPRRWVAAAYSAEQVRRLRKFERWVCQQADWVTAVSYPDKAQLEKLTGGKTPITVIPNSLDVQQFQLEAAEAIHSDIVFSGKMDYRPNVDAVLWFLDEVWPKIRQERPSTTFTIVGQKPHARLARLKNEPGITLTGWVERVESYLVGAKVFILPFRVGSGTRLKLIEAMAAGKALVSTAVGAEGFPVQHDRELMLVDESGGFGTAVLHLLENPDERKRLGQTAQQFAQQYDWRVVVPKFLEGYGRLLA